MNETREPAWPTDADLSARLRRACAEADGFRFEDLEPHDYQKHAARLMEVIPAREQYYATLRNRADAVASELHRRLKRLNELRDDPERNETVLEHVRGETIGVRAALGILVDAPVRPGSDRVGGVHATHVTDCIGEGYYREWLKGQAGTVQQEGEDQ